MQASFDKAVEQKDLDAQKAAIAELTNVPTNIVFLAQKYETKPTDVISDQTFKSLTIGPTAKVGSKDNRVKLYDELIGLDPNVLEDNTKIRNTFESFQKDKTQFSKQSENITKYLNSIPKLEELQNEAAITEGSGEGVEVPGQPMGGEITTGVEGVDRTGLGGTTDNVQQLAGREGPRPAALAPETLPYEEEVIKPPKFKASMGIMAYLKQNGGLNIDHIEDLTGEKNPNRSGATVGLFTKNGQGLDDAVETALNGGYLSSTEAGDVDGGVQALRDLITGEIQGKKAVPLDQQGDTELEAYLAREQRKADMQEVAPSDIELNKDVQEIAAEKKGRDVLFGPPLNKPIKTFKPTEDGVADDFGAKVSNQRVKELESLVNKLSEWYKKPAATYKNIKEDRTYSEIMEGPFDDMTLNNPGRSALSKILNNSLRNIDELLKNATNEEQRNAKSYVFREAFERAKESTISEGPTQQLGKRNPIFDKVTNGRELFKAVMKIANNRSDKAIINMLERVPNLETVKVITENTSTDPELQGASGYFDPNTNTIFVDPRVNDLAHITLHEIAHAATDATFDTHVKIVNNVHTPITPLGKKMVKLFDAFMTESLKKQEGFYAQKNVKEFFMESYTDPKLKNFLQNRAGVLGLKPAQGKIATLWSDFVNLIKSMFGVPEYAHSMLSEILLLSPELMKGPGAITTGKEVSQARTTPEMTTRPDGTPFKFGEDTEESITEKFNNFFNGDTNQFRKFMDQLGINIIGGRYSVERKALDANLPEVDAYREGRIRGDLINLQAYNNMSLAQSGLYLGRLVLRKTGLIMADESSGPVKVKMLDISKTWNELVDKATQELGSKRYAREMLVAGYYGPRYAKLAEFNETANADEKIYIGDWTESDKNLAAEAYKRYGTELKNLQDMRNVQRKDLLDFMVDANLYTREKANRFLDRAEYVALYRVPEEEIVSFDKPAIKGQGLLGAGKEYRLIGSDRAAADPIDNYTANMAWMMQRGIRNNALKQTADMMQQLGIGQYYDRPMTDIEKKTYNHVTIHVDGLPKDFRVDDANDMAAFSGAPIVTGFVWDILKGFSNVLRHAITMFPQFVFNQINEDPIRATFVSGNKAGFLKNIKNTWVSVYKNQFNTDRTPNADLLYKYGIVGQRDILDSKDIINMYKGKDKSGFKKSLFFFERMAQGADLGAREAIFQSAVEELTQQGYDLETAQDYASVRAHQYMPYQQVGLSRSLAGLRAMIPFVNPPIQGIARDIAAARGRIGGISRSEGKRALAYRLAKYLMFTAMYTAFMSGDDEYENQSDDQQDNNFFIGGLRIAVPQEFRPLKVAVERGTRAYVLNAPKSDETPEIVGTVIRKTWEIIAGFMPPIPTALKPAIEAKTNYSFFSNLPIVGAGQQRKEPYLQYTDTTSELAKMVGAQLNYSPIKVDYLLKGYFGYLGSTLGQMSNYLSGDKPSPKASDIIFVGSFLENPNASGNKSDFYDLYDKVVTAKASANVLLQEGKVDEYRDYMQKNKGYIAVESVVNNLHNQITKLREYKRLITASNRSPEEKREALDKIIKSENNMLDNIKQLNKRAVEINKQD